MSASSSPFEADRLGIATTTGHQFREALLVKRLAQTQSYHSVMLPAHVRGQIGPARNFDHNGVADRKSG